MPRNYDTTKNRPYPRVTEVILRYAEDSTPTIEYVEQIAVVDGDKKVRHLADSPTRHTLLMSEIKEPAQIVDPATGIPIPGKTVTSQFIMLGILAFLRADQLRRDSIADEAGAT